jgi:catechol 2,3-dioxygenase-like lactoylglutathione lyase family enzyme
MRVDLVTLIVDDYDRAIAFFVDVLAETVPAVTPPCQRARPFKHYVIDVDNDEHHGVYPFMLTLTRWIALLP